MGTDLFTCPHCKAEYEPEEFDANDNLVCLSCGTKIHLLPDGTCTYALEDIPENVAQENSAAGDAQYEVQDDAPEAENAEAENSPNALLDFSPKEILAKMKNEKCDMILGGITILWLLVFTILFLYNCIFASSIIENEKKETEIAYQQRNYEQCTEHLEAFGKVLLKYAKDNDGKLPDLASWVEKCKKYVPENYSVDDIAPFVDHEGYKVNPDLKNINDLKDARMFLVFCPKHQVAFYTNGKIEKYAGKDKK